MEDGQIVIIRCVVDRKSLRDQNIDRENVGIQDMLYNIYPPELIAGLMKYEHANTSSSCVSLSHVVQALKKLPVHVITA